MKKSKKIRIMAGILVLAMGFQAVSGVMSQNTKNTVAEAATISVGICLANPSLRMRSGPGTGYGQVGSIRYGEKVTVLSVDNGWARVEYTDKNGKTITGYSSAEYLSISTIEIPDPVVTEPKEDENKENSGKENSDNKDTGKVEPGKDETSKENTDKDTSSESKDSSSDQKGNSEQNTESGSDSNTDTKTEQKTENNTEKVDTSNDTVMEDPAAHIIIDGEEYLPLNRKGVATTETPVYAGIGSKDGAVILNGKKVFLPEGKTVLILAQFRDSDGIIWYKIKFTYKGTVIVGYVTSSAVSLHYQGQDIAIKLKAVMIRSTYIRTSASTKAENTLLYNGEKVSLKPKAEITIIGEVTVGSVKWFEIKYISPEGNEFTGYIKASFVNFYMEKYEEITKEQTNDKSETEKENDGNTQKDNGENTDKENGESEAKEEDKFEVCDGVVVKGPAYVYLAPGEKSALATYASNDMPISLSNGTNLTLYSKELYEGKYWYLVLYHVEDYYAAGYISENNIRISSLSYSMAMTEEEFEIYLIEQGFPESYKQALRDLHKLHPYWQFEANHLGIDWNTAVKNESTVGKNLIPNSKNIAWKSTASGAYKWISDTFVVYDGSYWVTVSTDGLKYYMDPRNFLTENTIFQFELLSYQATYQTIEGVTNILKNTPMYNASYTFTDSFGLECTMTYAEIFMAAAAYSGVSPYHLASRCKQEIMTSSGNLSSVASGTVSGYEGLYNFYNIGATNSTAAGGAVANALKYARNGGSSTKTVNVGGETYKLNDFMLIPWTDHYKAILGGAAFLGVNYIQRGQNTIYLEKFNMTATSTFSHQYQSGVEVGPAESKKIWAAYSQMDEMTIVFSIPVYDNMPETACAAPANQKNPNNWLKSLEISGYSLTPTFDPYTTEDVPIYNLIVDNDVTSVKIKGATASKYATATGLGTVNLSVGANVFPIEVKAENGDTRYYYIIIERLAAN